MKRTFVAGAVLPVATALVVAVGTPTVSAETLTYSDTHGTSAGWDIHSVRVRHEGALTVTVQHDDINRGDPTDVTIFIDTRPAREGAELIYTAGISGESDYYL